MITVWIRHGETEGNLEKRYIGKTDEALSEIGRRHIREFREAGRYPAADLIFVSPMRRCVETAGLIYPGVRQHIVEDFRECDFGEFEGKNYLELSRNEAYLRWIDSNGTLPFPAGENTADFKKRCRNAFLAMADDCLRAEWSVSREPVVAAVVHGGTIMSVLEAYGVPEKGYFDYQCGNGCGYLCRLAADGSTIRLQELQEL